MKPSACADKKLSVNLIVGTFADSGTYKVMKSLQIGFKGRVYALLPEIKFDFDGNSDTDLSVIRSKNGGFGHETRNE